MPEIHLMRASYLLLFALTLVGVSACSTPMTAPTITQVLTPYKFDRVQGNVVTREQADALRPGMTKTQVRDILGTPLLSSAFHADRWDFAFTFYHQGAAPQSRHFAVYFKGDLLDRFDAEDLPREAEFVASLKSLKESSKLPAMEAAPESLQAFVPHDRPADNAAPALNTVVANYPPLEPRKP